MESFPHTGLTSDGDTDREVTVADSEGLATSEGEEPPLLDSKVVVEKVVEEGTQSAAADPGGNEEVQKPGEAVGGCMINVGGGSLAQISEKDLGATFWLSQ